MAFPTINWRIGLLVAPINTDGIAIDPILTFHNIPSGSRIERLVLMRGSAVEELIIIGFADSLRAVEVLAQLQRLKFVWSVDLRTAVTVQVERDGRLRLHHSQLLDPANNSDEAFRWKAILNAIVPQPHMPPTGTPETAVQVTRINAEGSSWLRGKPFNDDFIRDAAAVLRPGNSAILAILRHVQSALPVLAGYSPVVLHVGLSRFVTGDNQPPER